MVKILIGYNYGVEDAVNFPHGHFFFWLCWVFIAMRGPSLVVASGGPLFVAVHRPLTAVASPVAEHGLQ